ncbi:MAG: AAA family ATPase [Roseovarius sp.]
MDILQIRGENIASLARAFDIRLDAPPLLGAGLFAITGPTGSGKSSLLDAMCLALYGDCPRLGSAGVSDTVPDVSGEMLQSSDARTILRRGAASGHATVRFVARDGAEYEASWSVRRAYGKSSAKLQSVDRSVTRLSDSKILENQTRAVNERIVALTGLTYDEFRRSVLLAQGDFDSFLSARTSERAAILEKVTGTGLYRDISKRVFAAHAAAERKVQDLETKLGEHSVLSDEARAELQAQMDRLTAERAKARIAIAATQQGIERHEALEGARLRSAQAAEALSEATAIWAARQGDVAQLARLERAAGIRAEHTELTRAQETEAEARGIEAAQAEAATLAETALVTAEADLTRHRAAHDQIEARFAELGKIWDRAAALDVQVERAIVEEGKAKDAYEARHAEAKAAQAALEEATRLRAGLDAKMAPLHAQIEADPQGDALIAAWPVLSDRIERRIAACAAGAKARARHAEICRQMQGAQARKAAIAEALEKARTRTAAIEAEALARTPRRDALHAKAPAQRLARLERSASAVRNLRALARQYAEEAGHADAHLRGQEAARNIITASEAAQTEAQEERTRAEAQIAALEAPAGLAEAALSAEAHALRLHLVDGQPCPVCHARAHPVHDDSAARALAEDLRAKLEAARTALRRAVTVHEASAARADQAQGDLAQLGQRHQSALDLLRGIEAEYARACEAEAEGPISDRIPPVPADAGPDLDGLAQTLAGWQASLETELTELEALEAQAQADEAQLTECAREMRAIERERAEIDEAGGEAQRHLDAAASEMDTQARTREDLDTALSRDFADLGLSWDSFDADGAAHLADLAQRKDAHAAARDALQSLAEEKRAAERAVETAQAYHETLQKAAAELEAASRERQSTRETAEAQRAALLGGEETSSHRTAFNQRRKAAQDAKEVATEAHSAAASALSGAKASHSAATRAVTEATARTAKAEAALSAALARAGLEPAEAKELLRWSAESASALSDAVEAARDALVRAQQSAENRKADLAELEKAGVPETPLPDLRQTLETQNAEETQRVEDQTTIRNRQQADRETRARMADIAARITAAKADCDTLAAINDTIGSASGDRFATIAQEVTLALLVEQANHHLADIKPRYRLARGQGKLSLHVVDEDMAGEIRSTRSLSGGERFLVSLALALALGAVGGSGTISGTLFIDEGFGTLDAGSLDMAIDALEALQAQGRMIGVISHVQAMQDRIPVQIQIKSRGAGASEMVLRAD